MTIEIRTFERVERTWCDKVRNTLANFFTAGFWKDWKNAELENALKIGNYDAANHAIIYGADRLRVFKFIDSPEKICFALAQIKAPSDGYKCEPFELKYIIANAQWKAAHFEFQKVEAPSSKTVIAHFLIKIFEDYLNKQQDYLSAKVALNLLEDYRIIKLEHVEKFYKSINKDNFDCWKSAPYHGSLEAYRTFVIKEGFK